MIRNFTQDNQNRVTRLFVAINPDNNDEIATQAQRIRGKYSSALGRIGGSSLIETIIRDNRQMAAMKRSAAQRLGVNFSNMVALDRPYGQSTFDRLTSLLSALIAFQDVIGVATNDVKTGGINKLDPKTFIASLLTISDVDYRNSDDISIEQININTLRTELQAVIASDTVTKIGPMETQNAYEYYIRSNYAKNNKLYKLVKQNREKYNEGRVEEDQIWTFYRAGKAPAGVLCASYVSNSYNPSKTGLNTFIYDHLVDVVTENRALSYTNYQCSAFTGGYLRSQYNYKTTKKGKTEIKEYTTLKDDAQPLNGGKLADGVLMEITYYVGEGIKYKIPDSTEYKYLEGTEDQSGRQMVTTIMKTGIVKENDIVSYHKASETKETKDKNTGKVIKKATEIYPSGIGQVHTGSMSTPDTYSAANDYVFRSSIYDAADRYDGMTFIVLNSDVDKLAEMAREYGGRDEESIKEMLNLYNGGNQ